MRIFKSRDGSFEFFVVLNGEITPYFHKKFVTMFNPRVAIKNSSKLWNSLNFDTRCAISLNSFMCWVSSTTKNGLCLEKIWNQTLQTVRGHKKQWPDEQPVF